jgi:hypothetical protein
VRPVANPGGACELYRAVSNCTAVWVASPSHGAGRSGGGSGGWLQLLGGCPMATSGDPVCQCLRGTFFLLTDHLFRGSISVKAFAHASVQREGHHEPASPRTGFVLGNHFRSAKSRRKLGRLYYATPPGPTVLTLTPTALSFLTPVGDTGRRRRAAPKFSTGTWWEATYFRNVVDNTVTFHHEGAPAPNFKGAD